MRSAGCRRRTSGREAATDISTIVGTLSAPDNRTPVTPARRDGACPVSDGGKIQGSYQGIALAMPKVPRYESRVPHTFAYFANVWALREHGSSVSYDKVSRITRGLAHPFRIKSQIQRLPRPCPCVLCRDRAGNLTWHPQLMEIKIPRPVAKDATRAGHPRGLE